MVSGTRCPAWSDQLRKWSESRAAAPKGRCPVGQGQKLRTSVGADFWSSKGSNEIRDEDRLGLKGQFLVFTGEIRPKKADFRPQMVDFGPD